jgi:hypothetical protein
VVLLFDNAADYIRCIRPLWRPINKNARDDGAAGV